MPRRLGKAPEIYTIAARISFVDGLAKGVMTRYGADPVALSDVLILVPNRRAVRSLRDAFLRLSNGTSMLLPRIEPIGDVDEDELTLTGNLPLGTDQMASAPAIPSFQRQILLMDIIERWYERQKAMGDSEEAPETAQRAILANALGQFLDHVQTEQLSFKDLAKLVPEDYATHWQKTLDFLKILTQGWPQVLQATGYSDAAERRNILLQGLRDQWLENPPKTPVIAAGSTGSIPATSALLEVVARLPQGMVVLPGLDKGLDPQSWDVISPTHPQYTMKHLLQIIGSERISVEDWLPASQDTEAGVLRENLLRECLRPAETTDRWRELHMDSGQALQGLVHINAPTPREEAGIVALMLRQVLQEEGKTAALVTPDRQLARRVAAELKRWQITIDDSAGTPLFNTRVGLFLRLSAHMVGEGLSPVALLSVLKHPLCRGGQPVTDFRQNVRKLERLLLRGARPSIGTQGISQAIALALKSPDTHKKHLADLAELKDWWAALAAIINPFEEIMKANTASFEDLLIAHITLAESLAADGEIGGAERLWKGDDGEEAARLIEELQQAAVGLNAMNVAQYPALLEVFMSSLTVRPKYGQHPRLNIWGPLEARLQHVDLVILSGLNEGSWPPETAPDPWMSRPMRAEFGLPSLEQKVGLSAHDFVQAASAPNVVLTRSQKVAGTPTVKCRWLSRMEAIVPDFVSTDQTKIWLKWYESLDHPQNFHEIRAPKPTPPLEARPRELSVTRVQSLMQDPYSIYASKILGLYPLDPLDADPGAADKGNIIHDALDVFIKAYPDHLPDDAEEKLIEMGRIEFGKHLDRPTVLAFWWPRFEQIAAWFVAEERTRRSVSTTVATEVTGSMVLKAAGGDFILSAKADRIDQLADGSYSIIDYKTGKIPTARQIYAGFAPQLPLEAALAQSGSFAGLAAAPVSDLSYWQLKGGKIVGKITAFNEQGNRHNKMDVSAVTQQSVDGLMALISTFDLPQTPYLNNPRPDNMGYGDYDHLARTLEWTENENLGGEE